MKPAPALLIGSGFVLLAITLAATLFLNQEQVIDKRELTSAGPTSHRQADSRDDGETPSDSQPEPTRINMGPVDPPLTSKEHDSETAGPAKAQQPEDLRTQVERAIRLPTPEYYVSNNEFNPDSKDLSDTELAQLQEIIGRYRQGLVENLIERIELKDELIQNKLNSGEYESALEQKSELSERKKKPRVTATRFLESGQRVLVTIDDGEFARFDQNMATEKMLRDGLRDEVTGFISRSEERR